MTLGALVDSRIGSLASGRVYGVRAPESVAAPYIIWRPISNVPNVTHDDFSALTTAVVQVDSYATTAAAADALRTLAVAALCAGDDATPLDVGRMQDETEVVPPLFNAQADIEITFTP